MADERTEGFVDRVRRSHSSLLNRNTVIFLFFLLLSLLFWYLNSLSKEVESTIRYPVRYINPPSELVIVGDLPSKLEFSVRGPGYSILKTKLSGSRAPAIVDMSQVRYHDFTDSTRHNNYIVTSTLTDLFRRQLRAEFVITDISPDTVVFSFHEVITKRVPVRSAIEVATDRQYLIKGDVIIEPDSVDITGPAPLVDTVSYVSTRSKRYNNVSQSFRKTIQIESAGGYSISTRRVAVEVNVEQFTEARIELPVKVINKPDSISVRLFPDIISVRLLVAVSDYNVINDSNISAVIDMAEFDIHATDKLPVMVINVPDVAREVNYTPQQLDFIIEKVEIP